MRPAVATVLSARPWESAFVRLARASALVRVVTRAWEPAAIDEAAPGVVVIGGETAWMSRGLIAAWRRLGRLVLGVHAAGSLAERAAILDAGADLALPDDDVERILLTASRRLESPEPSATMTIVVGARGAPGRSTVALAVARTLGSATLVDADPAPNLGPALGLPPGPTHDELLDDLRSNRPPATVSVGGTNVLAPLDGRVGSTIPGEVLSWLRARGPVVVDTGPFPSTTPPSGATTSLFVVDASAVGLVRAAEALREWDAAPPVILLNRVGGDPVELLRACRAATGLEPAAYIPRCTDPPRAADAVLAEVAL